MKIRIDLTIRLPKGEDRAVKKRFKSLKRHVAALSPGELTGIILSAIEDDFRKQDRRIGFQARHAP